MEKYDICVVGAGISGASLAAFLGKNGKKVAIVEQNWDEPDEIIGELLQPSGVIKLQKMGFERVFDGFDAQPIYGYAMFLNEEFIRISYPSQNENIQNGYGFRYGRFVQKLRSYLEVCDTVTKIKGKVIRVLENDNGNVCGIEYASKDSENSLKVYANLTIVCQGSASRLRMGLSKGELKVKGHMMGFILEDCNPPFENHGHVIIADPAPILVYPVATNKLRVLIDFPKDFHIKKGKELEDHLIQKISPQLPEQIRKNFISEVKKGEFKSKSTCLLAAKPILKKNVVLLGDSLNQRHPSTGGGMTVALTDVQDLGNELIKIDDFSDSVALQKTIKRFYKNRYKENATINILAYSLYSVFKHPALQKACFSYLQKGGKFSAQPMSILSGISRNRLLLIRHFFLVAFHGVAATLRPVPTPVKIARSFAILTDAVKIIMPLLVDEFPVIYLSRDVNKNMSEKI